MQSSSTIRVSEYLSVAISIAEASGMIIREVYESGILDQKDKGGPKEDNPVTIADLKVQKTIEETFKHFFPNL
jgi:fructose-1,6-bisphosphatase/inositol monophosphatase family enzyme